MTSNSHFKERSAVFACRSCQRRTRDTNGSNGSVQLCEDCEDGFMWENGGMDTNDEAERAHCFAKSDAAFRRAIAKGGVIPGRQLAEGSK